MNSLNYKISNKEFKWAFSSTKVKLLEKRLISQSQIDSLIGAENRAQFIKILSETRYAVYVDSNNLDIENLYRTEINGFRALLPEIIPAKEENLDFLFIRADLGLLKRAYKLYSRGSEYNDILSNIDFLDKEQLLAGFAKNNFSHLGKLGAVLDDAIERELPSIDKEIDVFYFSSLKKILKRSSSYIGKIIRWEIDFYNLKMVLRSLLYEQEGLAGRKNIDFIEGGSVSLVLLNESLEEGIDTLLSGVSIEYKNIISNAWDGYKKGNSFVTLDIGFYNLLISHVKEAKYYLLRVETVAAYILAFQRELMLIRRGFMLANNEIEKRTEREQTYAA